MRLKIYKIFQSTVVYLLLVLNLSRLAFAADVSTQSLFNPEEKILQATNLYYDSQFNNSKKLLSDVISTLTTLPKTVVVKHNLSEAYLLIALNQFAQSETEKMNDSLLQSVVHEPNREVDPIKYPPSFIQSFINVKRSYLLLTQSGHTSKSEGKRIKEKKPFYKTWPFFVIVGAVVAGGAAGTAMALGGGGGNSSTPVTLGGTPQ